MGMFDHHREVETPLQKAQNDIRTAMDSVTVINEALEYLASEGTPVKEVKGALKSNVGHLKVVVARDYVISSGEDLSALNAAITAGEAKLAENIWNA